MGGIGGIVLTTGNVSDFMILSVEFLKIRSVFSRLKEIVYFFPS